MNKKGNQRCWTEVPGVCCNPRRHDTEHTNEFIHLNMDAICNLSQSPQSINIHRRPLPSNEHCDITSQL